MLESRVLEVFVESGLNRQDFAARLGISNAVLSHISSGRNKASIDLVINVLEQFSNINPDWLLFGKGKMHRSDANKLNEEVFNTLMDKIKSIRLSEQANLSQIQNLENEVLKLK